MALLLRDLSSAAMLINFKLAQHHLDDEDNNAIGVVSTDFDGRTLVLPGKK